MDHIWAMLIPHFTHTICLVREGSVKILSLNRDIVIKPNSWYKDIVGKFLKILLYWDNVGVPQCAIGTIILSICRSRLEL